MKNTTVFLIVFFFIPCWLLAQNAGKTSKIKWQPQNSGLRASLRGLSAVDENVAWVSGSQGSCARTIDGGTTWKPDSVAGADSLDLRDLEAFDANTAFLMSAGAGRLSRIYKTTDGGKSWHLLYTNTHSVSVALCTPVGSPAPMGAWQN
jgi:photosystem II stability/assembly factor-like uncharacterized protein